MLKFVIHGDRLGKVVKIESENYESADFIRFLKKHNPSEPEFSIVAILIFRMISADLLTCVCEYRMRELTSYVSNARNH